MNSGVWIEGIGDTRGVLNQTYWHITNGIGSNLVCFKQNNEVLYNNETLCTKYNNINCCNTDDLGIYRTNSFNDIKIQINDNYVILIFSNNNIKKVKVVDITGKVVFQTITDQSEFSIDKATHSSGVYILWIQYEEGITTHKVLF